MGNMEDGEGTRTALSAYSPTDTVPSPAPMWPRRLAGRGRTLLRAYPYTALVLALGLILRAILTPITHGPDFVVWDLATRATLRGVNVYAHHPPYPGGPYAYTPLFIYVELPFQWLALHLDVPFTVLGKIPILAGDVLAALLIAARLAHGRGHADRTVALGTALYFLNPLVLYNGAFYGRFDTLCVALLLLALHVHDKEEATGQGARRGAGRESGWAFPLLYALAVAMKSYPIFLLPWLLAREPARRTRLLAALVAVVGSVSLPYLVTSPLRFLGDTLAYNSFKLPRDFSWQVVLLDLHADTLAGGIGLALLALFALALLRLTRRLDLPTYALAALLLFLLLSKQVIEQYFQWPLPFLIVLILGARPPRAWPAVRRDSAWGAGASLALLVLLSTAGMLGNPFVHPFGVYPTAINVAVAVGLALYLAYLLAPQRGPASDPTAG